MGGGPASADVVRASCLLTFPEETLVEPVPVDAWYLYAVGLTFLRRLARDRVGDELRIALIMQRTDDATQQKRYVSVSSDAVLKKALKETFDQPERVLVLHIIALDKVLGQKSIHVTPEINPNVSPEPVAPLGMVFPTLAVEAAQEVPENLALSSSFRLSRSVFDFEKPSRTGNLASSKQLSHSDSFLERSQDFGYSEKCASNLPAAVEASVPSEQGEAPFAFAAAGAKLIADDTENDSDIPIARVVGHAGESDAPRIPSDYVMLELQNGAGLDNVAAPAPANSASTFFISPTWHLYAEELSASARLRVEEARSASPLSDAPPARPISEWSSINTSNSSSGSSMEDSFVMLEPANRGRETRSRRIL